MARRAANGGTRLQTTNMSKFCESCGAKHPAAARFCGACGHPRRLAGGQEEPPLAVAPRGPEISGQPSAPGRNRRGPTWTHVSALALTLSLGTYLLTRDAGGAPSTRPVAGPDRSQDDGRGAAAEMERQGAEFVGQVNAYLTAISGGDASACDCLSRRFLQRLARSSSADPEEVRRRCEFRVFQFAEQQGLRYDPGEIYATEATASQASVEVHGTVSGDPTGTGVKTADSIASYELRRERGGIRVDEIFESFFQPVDEDSLGNELDGTNPGLALVRGCEVDAGVYGRFCD